MAGLTRALVERHALGRADAYDAALLDVAQDHLLFFLSEVGAFDNQPLVFKGGTSLRKCRLGNDGRFSTDLDFAAADEEVVCSPHAHGSTGHASAASGSVSHPVAATVGTGASTSTMTSSVRLASTRASSSPAVRSRCNPKSSDS